MKTLKFILILLLITVSFRGTIFRLIVKYDSIGSRASADITNQKIIQRIESKVKSKNISVKDVIDFSNSLTMEALSFTSTGMSNNPNQIYDSKLANCVGYSALFNSIANYIIRSNGLTDKIVANHEIGKLYIFGIDIHKYFNSPFFKDHDFNTVKNIENEKVIAIDPTVSDYLWINSVSIRAKK